jgi:aminomethyltransferase
MDPPPRRLFDVSHMGQLFVTGEGAEAALEALLPIDLSTLELGALRYSLLLADDGGILDDLIVARWRQGFFVVVNGATKHDDIAHMRERLPAGVTLDHYEDRALLALQGPEAFAALERNSTGHWPLGALTFMRGGWFTVGGVEAWISRTGYTGEDGFEISIPPPRRSRSPTCCAANPKCAPPGSARAIRCGSKPGCRSTGTTSTHRPTRSARASLGPSPGRREPGGFPWSRPHRRASRRRTCATPGRPVDRRPLARTRGRDGVRRR